MKRWILISAALVVGVMAAAIALPGVVGTSYAAWNATAPVAAGVSAGTWSPTPTPTPPGSGNPITSGSGPTTIVALNWALSNSVQFCTSGLKVGTSSSTPVPWVLSIDTRQPPFNGAAPSQVQPDSTISGPNANGILTITGKTMISGSQTQDVTICMYSGGNPPAVVAASPATYSYTTKIKDGSNVNNACAEVTVTGYNQFYVGFRVSVDWEALLAAKFGRTSSEYSTLLPKTLKSWYGGSGTWSPTQSGNVYTVVGTDPYNTAGIKSGQSITFNGCIS